MGDFPAAMLWPSKDRGFHPSPEQIDKSWTGETNKPEGRKRERRAKSCHAVGIPV
jgi:hypothetical protein